MFEIRRRPEWPAWRKRYWLVELHYENGEHTGISYYERRKRRKPGRTPKCIAVDFDALRLASHGVSL